MRAQFWVPAFAGTNGLFSDKLHAAALSEWARVHGLATLLVDGGLNPKRYPKGDAEALARSVLRASATL